jgi:hypothetical protein
MPENVYVRKGYSSRNDYLLSLAHNFGVSIDTVACMATVLGPSEDFDALVTELEDFVELDLVGA